MHHARPFSRSRRVGGRCVKMPLGLGIGGWLCASPRGFAGPSAGLCTLQCIDSNIPLAGARSEFGGPIRSIPPPLASSTRIHHHRIAGRLGQSLVFCQHPCHPSQTATPTSALFRCRRTPACNACRFFASFPLTLRENWQMHLTHDLTAARQKKNEDA